MAVLNLTLSRLRAVAGRTTKAAAETAVKNIKELEFRPAVMYCCSRQSAEVAHLRLVIWWSDEGFQASVEAQHCPLRGETRGLGSKSESIVR